MFLIFSTNINYANISLRVNNGSNNENNTDICVSQTCFATRHSNWADAPPGGVG